MREHIVHFTDWAAQRGWTVSETAALLQLAPRTVRHWQQRIPAAEPVLGLGRPALRSAWGERQVVLDLLDELGPGVSVATLHACVPSVGWRELADLLARYRRVWRRRHLQLVPVLRWPVVGSVWAIDFAQPPTPVDGLHGYLLAVRDLASGQQLLWQPLPAATGAAARTALASLFVVYGAPLVLKSDNGSPFGDDATQAVLRDAGVLALYSPPRTPRYNGAIEAGIGSLKTRSETHASRHGRPGQWTSDDVAAAQQEANATARPRGPTGPTPQESWQGRRPLTSAERTWLQEAVGHWQEVYRVQEGWPLNQPRTPAKQRRQDRYAIRRALEEYGYLLYARRRIPLPLRGQTTANIT